MAKYIKRNIPIEAEEYYLGLEDGIDDIITAQNNGLNIENYISPISQDKAPYLNTLEGKHYISKGDYIITGIDKERYPCKNSIFKRTYLLIT